MLNFYTNKAILIVCENTCDNETHALLFLLGILLDHICHRSTYNVCNYVHVIARTVSSVT